MEVKTDIRLWDVVTWSKDEYPGPPRHWHVISVPTGQDVDGVRTRDITLGGLGGFPVLSQHAREDELTVVGRPRFYPIEIWETTV